MKPKEGLTEALPDSTRQIIMTLAGEPEGKPLHYSEIARRTKEAIKSPRTLNKELDRLEKLGLVKRREEIREHRLRTTYSLTFDALKNPEIARPFLFAGSVSRSFYFGQMKRSLIEKILAPPSPSETEADRHVRQWSALSKTTPEAFLRELAHKIGSYVLFAYLKDLEDFMNKRAKEGERGTPIMDLAKLKKAEKGTKPGTLGDLSKENVQVTEWPNVLRQYLTNEKGEIDLEWTPLSPRTRTLLRDFDDSFITTMAVHSIISYALSKGTALKENDLTKAFDSMFAKESKVLSEVWQSPAQIIDYETGKKAYSSLVPSSKKGEALWPD